MQHVAVDVVGPEVLERAGQRLRDLRRRGRPPGRRAGGGPARAVGELGLQEQVRARDDARAVGGGERLPDAGLEVVLALVGGVDAAEARPQRELGRAPRCGPPSRRCRRGSRGHPRRGRGATDTPRAPVRSIAPRDQPGRLRLLHDAAEEREPRVASPRHADGLRHRHETAVEHARPGSRAARAISACLRPASTSAWPLAPAPRRPAVGVGAHERRALESGSGTARSSPATAPPRAPRRGRRPRPHASARARRHQVGRLDLEVGRGEPEFLALRAGSNPRKAMSQAPVFAASTMTATLSYGDDLDRHVQAPADVLHDVDRHPAGLAGRRVRVARMKFP